MSGLSPDGSSSPVGSGSTIWCASASRSLSSGRRGGRFRNMRPKRPSKKGDRETALRPRSSEPWKCRAMLPPRGRGRASVLIFCLPPGRIDYQHRSFEGRSSRGRRSKVIHLTRSLEVHVLREQYEGFPDTEDIFPLSLDDTCDLLHG